VPVEHRGGSQGLRRREPHVVSATMEQSLHQHRAWHDRCLVRRAKEHGHDGRRTAGKRQQDRIPNQWRCQIAEFPPPPDGIVLAHFIVSDDVERSRRFYTEVLGGRLARHAAAASKIDVGAAPAGSP
jgi:hypothetical protein